MQHDPITQAHAMLAMGRHADAIALIGHAASMGNVAALFQQAIWYLTGSPLQRDLHLARSSLRGAAQRGHAEAALLEIALVANGTGGRADWEHAMQLLEIACRSNSADAQHLHKLVSVMNLTDEGAPASRPTVEAMVSDRRISRVRLLLTEAECAHLAHSAADMLSPAAVMDPRTGVAVKNPIRTSDAATISPLREDPVIRAINLRIAAASETHIDQGEALTILRYRAGQQFRLHSDTLPQTRNQRIKTVLMYLNDGFEGGATTFPQHELKITPRAGDAIIFDNVDASGIPLASSRHAGEPVTQGTKWLATRWIRARPFDVWKGPEVV